MTQSRSWKNGQYCTHDGDGVLPTLRSSTDLQSIEGICRVSGSADGGQLSPRRGYHSWPRRL